MAKRHKQKKAPKASSKPAPPPRVAMRPGQFAAALSISRALLYTLEVQPRSVKLGGARVILESPEQYLQRVEALQTVAQRGMPAPT